MRTSFALLLICLFASAVRAEDRLFDALKHHQERADLVVLGHFVSSPISETEESGLVHYTARFKIDQHLKSPPPAKLPVPLTINVNVLRFEDSEADRPPQLVKGGRAILFLIGKDPQSPMGYFSADPWFAVQPPSSAMVRALAAMSPDLSHLAGDVPRRSHQLEGEWTVTLPAGFQREMTITQLPDGRYQLKPDSLNFGGTYRRDDDRLVSIPDEEDRGGVYEWQIRSPYLLTLVKQTTDVGADYTSAVLFRSNGQSANGETATADEVHFAQPQK